MDSRDLALWIIIVGTPLILVIIWGIYKIRRQRRVYLFHPTVHQYIGHHGQEPNDGIKCHTCGSREIWRYPWDNGFGANYLLGYLHQCHQCGTWLYRT